MEAILTAAQSPNGNNETIAITALGFIAADPELMPRFLALTGIEVRNIRAAAAAPGFLAGVMQFIMAHEPTLMKFSEQCGYSPEEIARAARALPQGDDSYDRSI